MRIECLEVSGEHISGRTSPCGPMPTGRQPLVRRDYRVELPAPEYGVELHRFAKPPSIFRLNEKGELQRTKRGRDASEHVLQAP